MNGARSTYMRKGYLLTALAAAVLLAASPGTASAQVEATLAGELAEGAAADITVTAEISIPEAGAAGTVTITAAVAAVAAAGTTHEADDVVLARPALVFTYPAGPADDSDTNTSLTTDMTFSGTIPVQAVHGDDDAEDEVTSITVTPVVVGGAVGKDGVALAAPAALPLTVKDDETQTYVLSLPAGATPTENTTISVTVAAVPPHEDESTTLTLHSSDPVNYVPGVSFIVVGSTTATPAGVNSGAVAIPAPANDQNRVTDTITLSAYSGVAGAAELRASLDFDVADIHTLPAASAVTAVAMDMDDDTMEVMEIEEGGDAVNVMISVDRGAVADDDASTSEALTVEVMAANAEQATDYRLTPTMVTLPAAAANGEQSATEMLMLSAVSDPGCRRRRSSC